MSKDRRLNQPFYREDQSETKRCCRGKRDGGLFKSQSSVASVLVSALIILNHFLFIKGQFLPLYQFSLDAKIENVYVELDLPKKGKSLNFSVPDVAISFPVANFTYNSTLTGLWTFNQVTQVLSLDVRAFLFVFFPIELSFVRNISICITSRIQKQRDLPSRLFRHTCYISSSSSSREYGHMSSWRRSIYCGSSAHPQNSQVFLDPFLSTSLVCLHV